MLISCSALPQLPSRSENITDRGNAVKSHSAHGKTPAWASAGLPSAGASLSPGTSGLCKDVAAQAIHSGALRPRQLENFFFFGEVRGQG